VSRREPRRYYWAFGSNLCIDSMRNRCPGAKPIKPLILNNGALTFRGVADVVHRDSHHVQGGLWSITLEDELNLDRFEGVSANFYMRRYFPMKIRGKERHVLFYQMRTHRGIMPPSEGYLDTIMQGYRDFGLDLKYLHVAVYESWGNKHVTPMLRERHIRRGEPRLARPERVREHILQDYWGVVGANVA
jgi:hypothetical protein